MLVLKSTTVPAAQVKPLEEIVAEILERDPSGVGAVAHGRPQWQLERAGAGGLVGKGLKVAVLVDQEPVIHADRHHPDEHHRRQREDDEDLAPLLLSHGLVAGRGGD
jgi:hypothetical protein